MNMYQKIVLKWSKRVDRNSSLVFLNEKNFLDIIVCSQLKDRYDLVTKAILGMRKSSEGRCEETKKKKGG